jgi:multisubunit Na+/H+ antiporter MnhC subunit
MPVYGKRMEKYAPEPTEEVKTIEKRFVMPKVTVVQIVLTAILIAYAWTARKMNGVVTVTIALAITLLHMYDHLYRVQRGEEHFFLFPKKEKYGCMACKN